MTREEMRERVAEIIRKGAIYPQTSDELADAAIAIIRGETLEEAAKVADFSPTVDYEIHFISARKIAIAIRALKEGK